MLARVLPFAVAFALLSLSAGCSQRAEPRQGPGASADATFARAESSVVSGATSAPEAGSAPAKAARSRRTQVAVPEHGCVVRLESSLGSGQRALVGRQGSLARVVVVAADGRSLSLWSRVGEGELTQEGNRGLDAPALRASLACGARCELSLVDERARLLALTLEGDRFSSVRELASGLDRRFAPAVTFADERVLYAYTSTVDDAMHTWLIVRAGQKASAPRDLTPAGHGAAAPTFVLGAGRPTLLVVDARAGLSPLLEIPFDADGTAGLPVVRTPVSAPYAPPLLVAVAWASGEVEVAYSAIGRAAMTAVGRVPLRRAAEPSALSPSRGYGELAFAAAKSGERALYAIEVPSAASPAAKRTLQLKLTDGVHTYDALSLVEGGEAVRPSLAAGEAPGEYLLGYTRNGVVRVALLACDASG